MLQQQHVCNSSGPHGRSRSLLIPAPPKAFCRSVSLRPVQPPAPANLTCHDSSSRTLVTTSAVPRAQAHTVPSNFDFLPTSLEAARQELATLAAPGTSWPPQAQPIEAAAQVLGGHFFLVSCGEYGVDHPLAGKPAYSLFQLIFCSCHVTNEPSPYSLKKTKPVSFQHSKDRPQDLQYPLVYVIAYEVDGNSWPTGAVYNTATAFEKVTTRKPAKKVLHSCRIIHQGQALTLLLHYYKRQLAVLGVEVPPPELVRVVGDWARDQLEAVGVQVLHKYQNQLAGRPTLASKRAENAAKEALPQVGTTGAPNSPPAAPAADAAASSSSADSPPPAARRRRRSAKQ